MENPSIEDRIGMLENLFRLLFQAIYRGDEGAIRHVPLDYEAGIDRQMAEFVADPDHPKLASETEHHMRLAAEFLYKLAGPSPSPKPERT